MSTALVGCTIEERPHLFVVGLWEKPTTRGEWRVPRDEVDATVAQAMERWDVRELAADPPGWHQEIAGWSDLYGCVVEYQTNRLSQMAPAVSKFCSAIVEGELSHDGDPRLAKHIANTITKMQVFLVWAITAGTAASNLAW